MQDDDILLISDDIPVMDRGHLRRGIGCAWDAGFVWSDQAFGKEIKLRKGRQNRGFINW